MLIGFWACHDFRGAFNNPPNQNLSNFLNEQIHNWLNHYLLNQKKDIFTKFMIRQITMQIQTNSSLFKLGYFIANLT